MKLVPTIYLVLEVVSLSSTEPVRLTPLTEVIRAVCCVLRIIYINHL